MKTYLPVQFMVKPAQYAGLNAGLLAVLADCAEKCIPMWWDDELNGTWYGFEKNFSARFTAAQYMLLIDAEVLCKFDSGIWIEGPTTAEDNLVPVAWPNSKKTVTAEDGTTTEVRKQFNEVTQIITGENGTSLFRIGLKSANGDFYEAEYKETPVAIAAYRALLPDADILIREDYAAWLAANTSTEG